MSLPTDTLAGLPPAATPLAHTLILGSMPGQASLSALRYYAHPRNAFWPIMGELFGLDPALPYDARLRCLQAAGIALWDVIAQCRRSGSLDAAIEPASVCVNDFPVFLAAHPAIVRVFFNGAAAENSFRRHVLARLERPLFIQRLPSTSPAHAACVFADKLAAWRVVAASPNN